MAGFSIVKAENGREISYGRKDERTKNSQRDFEKMGQLFSQPTPAFMSGTGVDDHQWLVLCIYCSGNLAEDLLDAGSRGGLCKLFVVSDDPGKTDHAVFGNFLFKAPFSKG